eukprot:1876473-Pleurochrysis_carterae.AAC.1
MNQLLTGNVDFIEHLLREHKVLVPVKKESAEDEEEDVQAAEIEPETTSVHFELYFGGDMAGVVAIAGA